MGFGDMDFVLDDGTRVSGVGCCLCNESIETTKIDPVTLDLTANDEEIGQILWAHARCLIAHKVADLREEFLEEGDSPSAS